MIKLVEVVKNSGHYNLREIIINSAHIISMVSDDFSAGLHANGKLPEGLHEAQQFSRVTFTNGKEITVVGSPELIGTKAKKVIHG
tara:strand:- start:4 stop:258 length:255 start_codon:yes stop_codon:yes gene_type:complete